MLYDAMPETTQNVEIKNEENKENNELRCILIEKTNKNETSSAPDTRSWDDMVITPLNGIPPLGFSPSPPRQMTTPLPYAESPRDEEELQFFLEME